MSELSPTPARYIMIGGFLGAFFEIDDAIGGGDAPPAKKPALPAGKPKK